MKNVYKLRQYYYSIRKVDWCLLIVAVLLCPHMRASAADAKKSVWAIEEPGIRMTLVAEHPNVVTPTGIDVDDQGHVWVVSSHTHFRPKKYAGPKHDEILVFDGKGKRSVFYNKTVATMDLELGKDGWVYLTQRDRVIRVRDTDGDGKGDKEENIATLKTESDYPHNGLSGMAWHPSGDLIFALGENYWKPWTLTGADGKQIRGTGEGGIFRCRPDGSKLRRIAKGFWNPFGVCVREDGEMFAVENDPGTRPPCRLIHVVEGGDYGYQRLYGRAPYHPFVAWDGELRGTLPMLHAIGEAPCGVIPLGDGLIVSSWSDHRIDFYPLTRRGASFTTKRIELIRGDHNFRPTCIARVSGRLFYFADWVHGSYALHGKGRVWKVEVDLEKATWLQPRKPEPLNDAALFRRKLIRGGLGIEPDALFKLARGDDAFLAHGALTELARRSTKWSVDDVAQLSVSDRVSAALALKRALPGDEKWVRVFLADNAADVKFEALRWAADSQLAKVRDEVDRILRDKNLDARLFEACLATLNTLEGNPRAGISDIKMLVERVRDKGSSPRLRGHALRLIPPTRKELNAGLIDELLMVNDQTLTLEVLRSLSGNPTGAARKRLEKIAGDKSRPANHRAEALVGLGASPDDHIDILLLLSADRVVPVREEALRSLRSASLNENQKAKMLAGAKKYPSSSDLLAVALKMTRDPGTKKSVNLAVWRKRIDAVKGKPDVRAGRRVFFHKKVGNCARCHRYQGRGAVVGPDLSAIGKRGDKDWLLASILLPSRDLSPQYRPWLVELEDGTKFTGFPLRNGGSTGREYYRDIDGNEKGLLKKDIVSRRELKTSIMPMDLVHAMTDRELRDLLAFLQGGEKSK